MLWLDPNHLEQVQIIKINLEKSNLKLKKNIWTRPKQLGQGFKLWIGENLYLFVMKPHFSANAMCVTKKETIFLTFVIFMKTNC